MSCCINAESVKDGMVGLLCVDFSVLYFLFVVIQRFDEEFVGMEGWCFGLVSRG